MSLVTESIGCSRTVTLDLEPKDDPFDFAHCEEGTRLDDWKQWREYNPFNTRVKQVKRIKNRSRGRPLRKKCAIVITAVSAHLHEQKSLMPK